MLKARSLGIKLLIFESITATIHVGYVVISNYVKEHRSFRSDRGCEYTNYTPYF